MPKLLKIDIVLVTLTTLGLVYLYSKNDITLGYALIVLCVYILSKILGYTILPYDKFDIFLQFLTNSSKVGLFSGFEIFKTTLVILLYLGFLFVSPIFWIVESVLVVIMRVWGSFFMTSKSNKSFTF